MQLRCYTVRQTTPQIVAARPDRAWMDVFPDQHPYRCLPLSIANTHGWEVLCPESVTIHWNGGTEATDLVIDRHGSLPIGDQWIMSNFSRGIVTMHTGYIFQTEPGWNLLATGPLNRPKDGISPLAGVIETNWLPYPFTMNWQLTRPGTVRFEENEPYCVLIPLPQNYLEDVTPEIMDIKASPQLAQQYTAWRSKRDDFMSRFRNADPETLREAWQKYYFKGILPDAGQVTAGHKSKLRLRDPVDHRLSIKNAPATKLVSGSHEPTFRDQGEPETAVATARSTREMQTRSIGDGSVLMIENFLSADDCQELIAAFDRCQNRLFKAPHRTDGFFDNRFLWINSLPTETERLAKRIMQHTRFRCIESIAEFYEESSGIYSDTIQLVKWNEGMSMPVHSDNSNPDGRPHPTHFRKYASVVYLNEDYEGGELFIPSLDLTIQPKTGLMVAFRGDRSHEHGVQVIKSGTRYTMPGWYSDDATHSDPFASEVY